MVVTSSRFLDVSALDLQNIADDPVNTKHMNKDFNGDNIYVVFLYLKTC